VNASVLPVQHGNCMYGVAEKVGQYQGESGGQVMSVVMERISDWNHDSHPSILDCLFHWRRGARRGRFR